MSLIAGGRPRIASLLKHRVRRVLGTFESADLTDVSARLAGPMRPTAPTDSLGPTIVLLNDCQDQDNFGAHALIDGLVRIVRDAVPNAVIHPIPSHWLLDSSNGFGAFINRGAGMRQLSTVYPVVADQFEAVADEWLTGRGGPGADELLKRFDGADLVVLNAEGSVYRTNLSAIRELFLVWLCKTRLGLPTIFTNATVHLTEVMPVLPAMVRKTLPLLDAVTVREPWSLRNLAHYAPQVDAGLIPDSAFALNPQDAHTTSLTSFIRSRIGDSPYFCFDPGPMPIDHRAGRISALYRLIMALKQVTPNAVFVRTDPADTYVAGIAAETDSVYLDGTIDYREWMSVVEQAQFLVTGRYHNPMLAAIMGCPSIALASTSHKVHGGCEMLELIDTPYDGTDLSSEIPSMADHARRYVAERAVIRDRLLEVCERRRAETGQLGRLISNSCRHAASAATGTPFTPT